MQQVNKAVRTAAALYRKDFFRENCLLWSKNMARHRSLDGLRVYNCVVDSVLSPAPLCRLSSLKLHLTQMQLKSELQTL